MLPHLLFQLSVQAAAWTVPTLATRDGHELQRAGTRDLHELQTTTKRASDTTTATIKRTW